MGTNSQALAGSYPYFNTSEISAFHQQFSSFDKGNSGWSFWKWSRVYRYSFAISGRIHQRDLANIATKAGESFQSVTAKLSALKLGDQDGNVSFEDFLKVRIYAPICPAIWHAV